MATITSAANGNWSATATWTGAAVPGKGDVAKLNHQVTLDTNNASVGGIDPTGSGCLINSQSGNRLIVGSGAVMYVAKGLTIT